MKKYLTFLRKELFLGILIISCFALLGSVFGARKESKEPLPGVTTEEAQLAGHPSAADAPVLTGILPLAASQNKWYNFKYALIFSAFGLLAFFCVSALYMRFYEVRIFKIFREKLGENTLFLKF